MLSSLFLFIALFHTSSASITSRALNAHGLTTNPSTFVANTFDYIIVGGGTAGLVVANRLSENSGVNVGVIDAGHLIQNEPLIDIPLNAGLALGNATLDWKFQTVPQPGVSNRVIDQPRGKVLGGSSGINYMVYDRASKPEYDAWGSLFTSSGASNGGWDWDGLLPYFKKHETVQPGPPNVFPQFPQPQGTNPATQGMSGPVKVGYSRFFSDLFDPFVQTFTTLFGVSINPDSESGDATGLFNCQRSVDDNTGARSYALTAFFLPAANRPNLLVLTGAEATKVLFSGSNPNLQATSVQFVSNSKTFTAKARTEIILSTGSYKTPQLLELSGIGGSALLNKFKIPVLNDLPQVGENLQDHTLLATNFILKDPAPLTYDALSNNATFLNQAFTEYLTNHTGILTASNPGITFNAIDKFIPPLQKAVMMTQLAHEISKVNLSPIQKKQYEIQGKDLIEGKIAQLEILFGPGFGGTTGTPIPGRSYLSFGLIGLHPFSRGSVHIGSAVGTAAPIINPRYFDFSWDRQILRIGAQVARKIASTKPLASFVEAPFIPSNTTVTDADFDEFVNGFMTSTYHPVGTAALAPKALGGVVDQNLLVYGTKNLRVIDASIIPILVAAHMQATAYAVGEKGADIIKRVNRL